MTPELNSQISGFFDRYQPMTEDAIERMRTFIVMTADFIARSRQPIETLTQTTLKLNEVSHQSLARLVKAQAGMVEHTVAATARHLTTAADAKSWQDFVDAQAALLPAERERFVKDVRAALAVLNDVRDEIKDALDTSTTTDKVVRQARKTAKKSTSTARKTAGTVRKKATRTAKTAKQTAKKTATKARTAKRRTRKAA